MEKLDLYDINKINTHATITRGVEPVPKGLYRYVVHACIFNSKGEMLIQKRCENKKYWPNLWDISVGGCVSSGETPQQAITREIKEELGIDIDLVKTRPNFTFSFEDGYDDFYLIKKDIDLSKCVLQKEEVSAIAYANIDEIKKLEKDGKFIKYQDHFFDFIFTMVNETNIFKE